MKEPLALLALLFLIQAKLPAQVQVQLGSGANVTGSATPSPVNIYYRSARGQMVYTAVELFAAGASPGYIQKLGFYVQQAPIYNLPGFTVKMKHTDATGTGVHDAGPFQEVYYNASYAPAAGGFDLLTLDDPFLWNGTDNILVDVCFDIVQPSSNSSGRVRYYSVSNGYRYIQSTNQNMCPNVTSFTQSQKPQILLEFAPLPSNDAGALSLDEPAHPCPGSNAVVATIANYGANVINSVVVNWEFDGQPQAPVLFNGILEEVGSGNNMMQVTLGTQDFVAGQAHAIKIWTSAPNGAADALASNDTLEAVLTPGLAGAYAIGGVSPDYSTFAEAIQELGQLGVCGPVIFNVRNGTYNEQVSLSGFTGMNAANTVTFQSESGDSSQVTLTFSASSADNYTVRLDGADWFRFKNMTIEATNATYARVVVLQNGASNNQFEHCELRGYNTTFTPDSRAVVYSPGNTAPDENNVFQNNYLRNGSYGFYFQGASSALEKDNAIDNNRIEDPANMGVYANYQDAIKIRGNKISTSVANSGIRGIYVANSSNNCRFLRNNITGVRYGIWLDACEGSAGQNIEVTNNFIQTTGADSGNGIYADYGAFQFFYHNSVQVRSTHAGSTAFYTSSGNNKAALNNIFANYGGGYAIYRNSTNGLAQCDYNNLYTAGANLGNWGGATPTLADWQGASSLDGHSLSLDPLFLSPDDYPVAQISLNGAAIPVLAVIDDIEGEPRDVLAPDIGADEFSPPATDAGVVAVLPPAVPFAAGQQTIAARIKNYGAATLTSLDIEWEHNGNAQPIVNWAGSLAPGDTAEVSLGLLNLPFNQSHGIIAWAASPNGMADPVAINDTSAVSGLYAGLSGAYTLGGTSPDFSTFAEAALNLGQGGVVGPVTFNIRDGLYGEQVRLYEIPGAGESATVIFQSESGDSSLVTLAFNANSADNYTILLDGADWIRLKKITLEAANNSYGRVLELRNGASHNAFEHCKFRGRPVVTSSGNYTVIYSGNSRDEYNVFKNNTILNGSFGIHLLGANSSFLERGLVIEGNRIDSSYHRGIEITYMDAPQIRENQLSAPAGSSSSIGFELANCYYGVDISKNQISGFKNTGIYLNALDAAPADPILVANNFIEIPGTFEAYGIRSFGGSYQKIYHNSVSISSTHPNARAFYNQTGANKELLNNVFSNPGGGYAIYTTSTTAITRSGHNCLYATGANLGYWNGNRTDLAAWTAASTLDSNSVSIAPAFVSTTDLHLANTALDKLGIGTLEVQDDIDGDARDPALPDIGADEIRSDALDAGLYALDAPAGLFPAGTQDVRVRFVNNGTTTLTSTDIGWEVNGAPQPVYNWAGSLPPGQASDTINLGSFDFQLAFYNVRAWTSSPNAGADEEPANDTLAVENLHPALSGVYTVGGASPDFAGFADAAGALVQHGVAGPVTFNVRNGTYNERAYLPPIDGMSAANTVTFQSEAGDSSLVTLTYASPSSSDNYTVLLDGADWFIFKHLTLEAADPNYNRVLVLQNSASHNQVENCELRGYNTNSNVNSHAVVYSPSSSLLDEYNVFRNSLVTQGDFGFYLRGNSTSSLESGNVIENCRVENASYRGVYAWEQDGVRIAGNYISTNSGSTGSTGIELRYADNNTRIEKNQITGFNGGIELSFCDGTPGSHIQVTNNFVQTAGNGAYHSIYSASGAYQDFVHNTVRQLNANPAVAAFHTLNGDNKVAYNNIFANEGGGYAIFGASQNDPAQSNNNNFYATGSYLGYWGAGLETLADWQGATQLDGASLALNPFFLSPDGYAVAQVSLNGGATTLGGVTEDIEGEIRDIQSPDIGCDEFTPAADDAGIAALLPPAVPFAAGPQSVSANLINHGSGTLSSATVHWAVNGALQTPVSWTGAVASGDVESVTLGTFDFGINQEYEIAAWTSQPNGLADAVALNDSASISSIYAGLSGAYTLGGASPDFNTFAEAATNLHLGGVTGAVAFNIRTGTYNEQLAFGEIPGIGMDNTVTFQSEAGDSSQVVLSFSAGSSANYTLLLDGADWMRFKSMALAAGNTIYGIVLALGNGATNNRFENCEFRGVSNSGTNQAVIYSGAGLDNNNTFINNAVLNGSYGFYLNGNNNSSLETGLVIENNRIENAYVRGIYLQYMQQPFVRSNRVSTNSNNSSSYGIEVADCHGALEVAANYVAGFRYIGIYVVDCHASSANPMLISNNFVYTFGNAAGHGIYSSGGSHQKFYHNTVHVKNTGSSYAFYAYQGSNRELRNNVFANTGGGYAIYRYASANISSSDYNDLYTNGSFIGYWDGNLPVLADWQAASSRDAHSIFENPLFIAADSFAVAQVFLDGAGVSLPAVSTDIEGEPRDALHPDIGCDEFVPLGGDAGIVQVAPPPTPFAAGQQPVQVKLKNFGADTLQSVTLNWTFNGSLQTPVAWTGAIASGDTLAVDLATVDFSINQTYNIVAWTSQPNGLGDIIQFNDSSSVSNVYAGLAGSYTVGGASPDFNTFGEAVINLDFGGVLGPVTFNVRDGTYAEQLLFGEITGADSLNTVTFQSESGDSTGVTLVFSASSAANYTILFDGADHVRFHAMTIESASASYNHTLVVLDGSDHLSFSNCIFQSASQSYTNVYVNGVCEYLNFTHNVFEQGYYGLGYDGNTNGGNYIAGIVIEHNEFKNQMAGGLIIEYQRFPQVNYNEIYGGSRGLVLYESHYSARVTGNRIYNISGEAGLILNYVYGTAADPVLVANNFVQVGGTGVDYGIYTYYGDYQDFYHNSVNLTNTSAGSPAFYSAYGSNKTLLNNIFANPGGGYAIYANVASAITWSDHNGLYTSGTDLGYWSGARADLAAWSAASGMDASSVSVFPGFASDTDLHVSNAELNGVGTPVLEVTVDIDGDPRNPTHPDCGADEFIAAQLDAGLVSVDFPVMPFAAGIQPVYISIHNNGLDTLTSATIDWQVNGIPQPPYNWADTLLTAELLDSVNIGSFLFEVDTAYSITAWVSSPNGMADQDAANDTVMVEGLYAALGGIYTIGGTDPDFPDFTSAVEAMERGGVIAEVIFNVRNGLYDEQLSIPEILGASAANTITFQPESGLSSAVILSYGAAGAANNYTLQLDGADWLRFKMLFLENVNSSYGRVVDIRNGANNNFFEYNNIFGIDVNSTEDRYALIYSGNSQDDHNVFADNVLYDGSLGFYYQGTGTVDLEVGTRIEQNIFLNQYYAGAFVFYQDAPVFAENYFSTGGSHFSYDGIYCQYCDNDLQIVNNSFNLGSGEVGIAIDDCDGVSTGRGLIANNFVRISGTSTTYGLFIRDVTAQNIYHNTVNINSTPIGSRALYLSGGNDINVVNNVLANSSGGYAVYDVNPGNITTSDYNDLYTTGATIGYWGGATAAGLAAWQSLSNQDANSLSVDPLFESPTDLHVNAVDLNNAGTPLPEVTDDIDGEARNPVAPDIGADEFTPISPNDAGIVEVVYPNKVDPFGEGSQLVSVVIRNNGTDTIASATINWLVNSQVQAPYNWTGFLEPGERDTVDIGNFYFAVNFPYDIQAYTSLPNGQVDSLPNNDSTLVLDLYAGLDGVYTLGGPLADFFTFSEAANVLNQGGMLGPVTMNVRNGTYSEQISLGQIRGSGAANTLTFQSESGDSSLVTLTNSISSPDYTVQLNGTDYVTFQNMTLQAGLSGSSTVLEFASGVSGFQLLNSRVTAPAFADDDLIESVGNSADQDLVFRNNAFYGGRYALDLQGQNSSQPGPGILVEGNTFEAQRDGAADLAYLDAPVIRSNVISGAASGTGFYGLVLSNCDNGMEVAGNKITHSGQYGIYLSYCDGNAAEKGLIANNFVHTEGPAATTGLYIHSCNFQNIYYNSIHVSGTNPGGRALYIAYGGNNNLLNNVLASSSGGYAAYVYSGSSLASSNHNGLYATGPWLGYWAGSNVADLAGWQALSGKDNNSVSANPLFYSDTDLHVLQVALDSTATAITGLTQDIDGDLRHPSYPDIGADEFDYLDDDLGIIALLSPEDDCSLGNAEAVKVAIQNFGGLPQTGFEVSYSLNGGIPVVENVGGLAVQPGDTAHYTFATPADLALHQGYIFELTALVPVDQNPGNNSFADSITNHLTPAAVSNMLPADGSANIDRPINFSWQPSPGALRYDFYLWLAADPMPAAPLGQDLEQITYFYNSSSLMYGATYNWQVVAKNNYCETPGPVQSFTMRELPDLVVQNVNVPGMPFSEQLIEVAWEVHNAESGGTGMAQWYDYVYLSQDNVYQPGLDTYLGGFVNLTALGPNQSYAQMKEVALPQGIQGTYYIFVVTDRNNTVIETDNGNNVSAAAAMPVTLTPPPDLRVASILTPNNAFSGQPINVTWVVENAGPGDMSPGNTYWDRIYGSDNPEFNAGASTLLAAQQHASALDAGETDTLTRSVTLPDGIFGDYFIHIETDVFNYVFEHVFENNNSKTSDTISVTLMPPPNLVVNSVTAPAQADNRETITLQWTVRNAGASPNENGFYDRVYFSSYDTYHPDSVSYLGQFYTNAIIAIGDSISRSGTVTIPNNASGTHYFYVFTDAYNQVFEYLQEDDNITRSNGMQVLNANLTASGVTAPPSTYAGAEILVEWTVENLGPGDVVTISRTDRVYLSADPVYDPMAATLLGSLSYNTALPAGQNLVRQKLVTLPGNISGTYYLHVFTDALDQVFEPGAENNNVASSGGMDVLNADLVIIGTSLADTTYSGTSITVEWTVENQGPGDMGTLSRTDKVYLSENPVYDPIDATLAGTLTYNNPLPAGQSLVRQKSISLPNGISGRRYVHIQTDTNDDVFEPSGENNNSRTDSTWVNLSPWPDLQVALIDGLPDTTIAGTLLTLNHTVQNFGDGTAQGSSWTDRVYLSPSPVWMPQFAVTLKNLSVLQAVGPDGSYTTSTDFILPMMANGASAGVCYIYVHTDATNTIYEHTDEGNNILRSDPIVVFAPPDVDLHILNATALPDTVWSGQQVNLQWMGQNQGGSTALWGYPLWYDGVYLCEDSIWMPDYEDFVKDFTRQGPLGSQETYADNQFFNIPNGLSGDYYAFLVADHTGYTNNTIDDESVWKIKPASDPGSLQAKPIHIKLSPSPDLQVNTFVAPSSGVAGQPVQVVWTVENNGVGLASGSWTDKIYLSTDFNIGGGDPIVGSKPQNRMIPPGGSYTDTLDVFIPISSVGNFVLIFKTDANHTVFEFNGEDNNIFFSPLSTSLPLPSDLIVGSVSFDTAAEVGEQFTVNYTLYNQGANPATGFIKDLVYFSADSIFDVSDVRLTEPLNRNISLAPTQSLAASASALTPGVPLGEYYIIVHTDVLNNIYESAEINNIYVSPEKVTVCVQELPLDSLVADTLANGLGIHYRIEIPDSLSGETMLVTLDGHTVGGANELYLSYGTVPTRSAHQYSFSAPFAPDQEIIVPEIQAGTYYLLAYGVTDAPAAGGEQSVDLKAEIIPFQIRRVQADKGGNTGSVTVKLVGARFEESMEVRLEGDSFTVAGQNLVFVNSTTVFVTFNLAAGRYVENWVVEGVPSGLYDVTAIKANGEITELVDGFEVLDGGFPSFSVSLSHPPNTRINREVAMTLTYVNDGSTDIVAPKVSIISLRGAPVALAPEDLGFQFQDVTVDLREEGGPPNVFRPGAVGSVTIYARSSAPMSFKLVKLE